MRLPLLLPGTLLLVLSAPLGAQLSFETAPDIPIGGQSFPRSPLVADFDGNGFADVVVARENPFGAILFIGDGSASFLVGEIIDLPDDPLSLASGDLDEDGILDLVVSAEDVRVYMGDGLGGFVPGQVLDPPGTAGFLAVALIDADEHLDLVVGGVDEVSVHLGDGTGEFGAAIAADVDGPRMIEPTDMDLDGTLDLLVSTTTGVAVLMGDGTGAMALLDTQAAAGLTVDLAVGDLDGNGFPDAVVTTTSGEVRLFAGQGGGLLGPAEPVSGFSQATGVDLADYDEDGALDVAAGSGGALLWPWEMVRETSIRRLTSRVRSRSPRSRVMTSTGTVTSTWS